MELEVPTPIFYFFGFVGLLNWEPHKTKNRLEVKKASVNESCGNGLVA